MKGTSKLGAYSVELHTVMNLKLNNTKFTKLKACEPNQFEIKQSDNYLNFIININ